MKKSYVLQRQLEIRKDFGAWQDVVLFFYRRMTDCLYSL